MSTSFSDFPEDVLINILSFLSPIHIAAFACTSTRANAICKDTPLWLAMCRRRWEVKTKIQSWAKSAAQYHRLYRTLDRWENLVGFWRQIGAAGAKPIVFFEWGSSYIAGSRVSPSTEADGYAVHKVPFLWLGLSTNGEPVCFFSPDGRAESPGDVFGSTEGGSVSELVPVSVSFMGLNHLVLEENYGFYSDVSGDIVFGDNNLAQIESNSPPDRLMSEIYQYFANRTSPCSDKSQRRQRKKYRERLGKRGQKEAQHFVKIVDYCPTPERPLQGLWKGITENMNLEFFLVTYDEVGGICCRMVCEAGELISGYPVFWNSNTTFIEPPLPTEECALYEGRVHICPLAFQWKGKEIEEVSRILYINSSYDLVIPHLTSSSGDPRKAEGRIWQYHDGTFGFGFLRNNYIIDLKHIVYDGSILDTVEHLCNHSGS